MMPVSGINTGAVRPVTAADKALEAPGKSEEGRRSLRPAMDTYVPEEKGEPSGRYWLGRDENGQPKVYMDGPEKPADAPGEAEPAEESPQSEGSKSPEKPEEETWVCDTGKVDREIEKLKKKRQELEQRLSSETDDAKAKDLGRQLAQAERELSEKDNDTYRRQHSTFTRLS